MSRTESQQTPNDVVRVRLMQLIVDRKTNLAAVSRAIGRNHAYLQQFVARGKPKKLPEDVRYALAAFFSVDQSVFDLPNRFIKVKNSVLDPSGPSAGAPVKLKTFAARLAVARTESKFVAPSRFAAETQIDRYRYTELEEGDDEPTLAELVRISSASGKSLDWLIRVGERAVDSSPEPTHRVLPDALNKIAEISPETS